MSDPDYELVDRVRAWLAALPARLTIEPHGNGFALYSMRDQPIDPERPVSHTNRQHGYQIVFMQPYDERMWPAVLEMLGRVQSDVAAIVEYTESLERENDALLVEVDRLSPPEPAPVSPSPVVKRALDKFYAKLAELQSKRPQEDDGEPE